MKCLADNKYVRKSIQFDSLSKELDQKEIDKKDSKFENKANSDEAGDCAISKLIPLVSVQTTLLLRTEIWS